MSAADPTLAARVKRHKMRVRHALMFAHIEISQSVGESMIELGYLPDQERHDPKQIGDAFWRYWKEQYVRKVKL